MTDDKYLLSSVDSSLKLMDLLSDQPNMGVAELSKILGLGKATVFRMLYTLEKNQYVTKSVDAKYSLGIKFSHYGSLIISKTSVVQVCIPYMCQIRDTFNETVHLATLTDDGKLLFVYRELSTSSMRMSSHVGAVLDAYSTGTGKILLAYLEPEALAKFTSAYIYRPYTERTVKSTEELLERLAIIRAQGYAEDNEEYEVGLYCLAAPIWNHTGQCIAALSISGPVERIKTKKSEIIRAVKRYGTMISHDLGYTADDLEFTRNPD